MEREAPLCRQAGPPVIGHMVVPTRDDPPTADGGIATRNNLASLYRPESMLTWEGAQQQGSAALLGALLKPELSNIKHKVASSDAQPASGGGVLVIVTGALVIDTAFDKPMLFVETFNLQPIPGQPGGFFINNELFRLIFAV
ncbi:nuclear transport factor 2 family protein [Archangium lansingense]|uniref:Nuclear transport factor 2 family protein n=1 Tax=Archangium lansingense TaxID=2995310 RepID=A0ABT4A3T3_9BACT|nr:nuclear transport factor 2 family protein [Archangium lansinium]MCY1076307.1 nuclear transport factor 2 family protein [Archangium lansinium]